MPAVITEFSRPFTLTVPGVYAPQHDTRLLLAALNHEKLTPGTEVLDLGTGSGALALRAAQLGGRVTAVDIAWRAVLTARLNAWLQRRHITVRRSDLTSSLRGTSYDLVLCNPPYVPAPEARVPGRGPQRAWDAGQDGRAVLDRVCDGVCASLRPGGVLLMVHSELCDTRATLRRLTRSGLRPRVTGRALVPLGPVLMSRREWLREQGLMSGNESMEELVVIRAERL